MQQKQAKNYRRRFKIYKTAFDWRAYTSRSDSLRLLWRNRIHVDTIIKTQDDFSDTVHLQVISAFCPKLIEASRVKETSRIESSSGIKRRNWIEVELPQQVNSSLAKQLLSCAYGEKLTSLDKLNVSSLYLLSNSFRIYHGIRICLDYAKTLLNVDNCVQFWLLSLKHKHRSLAQASYSILRTNFKLILHINKDFHLLPFKELKQLLLDDFLRLSEDEELAWVAILRWMSNRLMSTSEVVSIFNRMVSADSEGVEHQVGLKSSSMSPNHRNSTQMNINFAFHFYDSKLMHCESQDVSKQEYDYSYGLKVDNKTLQDLTCDNIKNEDQLLELIKCLRFFRFRSVNAFNVILEHKLLADSERLILFVNHMKLRYIMKFKLPINESDKYVQVLRESLQKLKAMERGKPKRIIKSVIQFVKCRQTTTSHNLGLTVTKLTSTEQSRSENEQRDKDRLTQPVLTSAALTAPFASPEYLKQADTPRVPTSAAISTGGFKDGAVCDSMLTYDFVCDRWFKLNIRLPEPRAFHASCSKGSEIFIFGGTNGEEILSSFLRFDPSNDILLLNSNNDSTRNRTKTSKSILSKSLLLGKTDKSQGLKYKFHSLCPMRERRCHLSGLLHSDGRIYALGGHNGHQRLRSGEWYNFKTNSWHPIAEMSIARSDASACSHDNKIYIAGGQISDQFIQSSVEVYKPSDDTWTFIAPMIVPRMAFRLVSHRNYLLAIGGTNGLFGGDDVSSVTRSVERYNFSQSAWCLCTPMNQRRSSFGVVQIENNLIVAGGCGGRKRLKTCESLQIGQLDLTNNQLSNLDAERQLPGRARILSQPSQLANQSIWVTRLAQKGSQTGPHMNNEQLIRTGARPARLFGTFRGISPTRRAMKWIQRANLPSKRSGFSVSVVQPTKNVKDLSYHGSRSTKRPSVIKRKSKLDKLKIVKRRKLVKYMKIGVIVVIVVIMM